MMCDEQGAYGSNKQCQSVAKVMRGSDQAETWIDQVGLSSGGGHVFLRAPRMRLQPDKRNGGVEADESVDSVRVLACFQ